MARKPRLDIAGFHHKFIFITWPYNLDPITSRKYRKDLKKRIESIYKNNPEAKRRALEKLEKSDIDHKLDLQLGGSNTRANVNSLDKSVNRSYGKQLDNILKDLGIE